MVDHRVESTDMSVPIAPKQYTQGISTDIQNYQKNDCVYTYMHRYVHTYTHTSIHTYLYTMPKYIDTYTHTYIHPYVRNTYFMPVL